MPTDNTIHSDTIRELRALPSIDDLEAALRVTYPEADADDVSGWPRFDARRLHDALSALPREPGLSEAWAACEAALPEGWIVGGVDHVGPSPMMRRDDFRATAWGPWKRSSRSVDVIDGFGPTPTAALQALTATLSEHGEPGTQAEGGQ